MKQTMIRTFALLCLVALFFPGCSKKTEAGAMGSEVWEEMPALTYGVMEYDKLEVLPWNSGRCEATSFDTMAETEQGYYMSFGFHYLYYADKRNLGNWIIVCNEPDCEHTSDYMDCNAKINSENFVIQNDRIYYQTLSGDPAFYIGNARMTLMSMAADGTNKKLEYVFDEDAPVSVSNAMSLLTSQQWLYNVAEINADGSHTVHAYRLTEAGAEKIATDENVESPSEASLLWTPQYYLFLYGDRLVHNGALNESRLIWYRYKDGQAEEIDFTDLPAKYAYLSGDTLRFFRANDGYYDMNIKTGEEVKLADARMENSLASIMLPNCVIETTLGYETFDLRTEGMTHKMELFDGQQWHSVKLPEELVNAGEQVFVKLKCVTSDSIILYSRDAETHKTVPTTTYYRIDLNAKEPELKEIAQITEQWYIIQQEQAKKQGS